MRKEGFGKLVLLDEAINLIFEKSEEVGDEKVILDDAAGRILAEDVVTEVDVPPFNKSAMDGFAVIAADTFGASNTSEKILKQTGYIFPGMTPTTEVKSGECIEIATGAPIPDGADAVLMVEYTEKNADDITIYKSVAPGDNVIKMGSDIRKNEKVLEKGTFLNPRLTAVLAGVGVYDVPVKKKPVVAVCSTGNELVRPPAALEKGQIYETNSRSIIDGLKTLNCESIDIGIAIDEKDDLKAKIKQGIEQADLMLLTGGSSMGATDLLVEVINELGEVLVHGIAVKPGKPTIISIIDGKLVFGLPGHPASALSNFYILIKPLIARMTGQQKILERFIEAKLTRKIASTIGRYEFIAVKLNQSSGKFAAEPILKGSSAITTLAHAEGFIEIEENVEVVERGEKVRVHLF